MILEVLKKGRVEKLNLDSLDLLRKITSTVGHLFEDMDKLIIGETSLEGREYWGLQRNDIAPNDKFLENLVQITKNNSKDFVEERLKLNNHGKSASESEIGKEEFIMALFGKNFEPRFMENLIHSFLKDHKAQDGKESVTLIRKFQLLIHKFLFNLEVLDPDFSTQPYIFHNLIMLETILDEKRIMCHSEIAHMFYTKHATNTLFSLIIQEYNFIG